MELSERQIKEYTRRLLLARMRVLAKNGFYGLLLMNLKLSIDSSINTAATDGRRLYFNPEFMDELTDRELDFILTHEILHIALQHVFREEKRDHKRFNEACDIVVNSNILFSSNFDPQSITLKRYGESMHLTPDLQEGCLFTAEQVYEMLGNDDGGHDSVNEGGDNIDDSDNGRGTGSSSKSVEDFEGVGARGSDSNNVFNNGDLSESSDSNEEYFDDDIKTSLASNDKSEESGKNNKSGKCETEQNKKSNNTHSFDDHSRWGKRKDRDLEDEWSLKIKQAYEASEKDRGLLSGCLQRQIDELVHPRIDWRTLLNDFIQEEIVDYSFSPPDRRFDDGPFFLPDFNEKDESIKNILFMIDTSGSMTKKEITEAYSEIKGAIDQFNGKLAGYLGFFDTTVIPPKPFEGEDINIIRAYGGGGTNFKCIFDYVNDEMQSVEITSIIILTDGYAPFPSEYITMGIPVMWIINNDIISPPWGRVARLC